MITFFEDRKLAKRFQTGDVSEKEQMLYLLIQFTLLFFATTNAYHQLVNFGIELSEDEINIWDYLADALWMFFAILYLVISYNANKQGDNNAFVARFVSIIFPVMFQASMLYVPLLSFAVIWGDMNVVSSAFSNGDGTDYNMLRAEIINRAISVVVFTYFLFRMNQNMKIASGVIKDV